MVAPLFEKCLIFPLNPVLRVVPPQRGAVLLHGKRPRPEGETGVGGHAAGEGGRGRRPREEAARPGAAAAAAVVKAGGRERRRPRRRGWYGGHGSDPIGNVAFALHQMTSSHSILFIM